MSVMRLLQLDPNLLLTGAEMGSSQTSPWTSVLPPFLFSLLWLTCVACFCCSVTKSCPSLCDPMDCSTPGFPVLHHLPEFAQTHFQWAGNAIQPFPLSFPFSSCLQSFPASWAFPMSQLFTSGGQSTGASASASVLPMNIQGLFPLRLTGLISLQSEGLSDFPSTTVGRHQFFSS